MDWKELWNFRGIKYKGESPTIIDGWDSGSNKLEDEDLTEISLIIKNKLELKKEDKLLEIGCGAGMVLSKLIEYCKNLYGIDYAESLINIIREKMPKAIFAVSEAKNIPFNEKFDKIFSFSVFQYFPDYQYAQKVLENILKHLNHNGKILIGDVPDLKKKEASEEFRGKKPHNEDVKNPELTHLYYDGSFFQNFAKRKGLKCEIFNLTLKSYGNSNFRFYALIY